MINGTVEPRPTSDLIAEEPSLKGEIAHELAEAARMGAIGVANEVVGNVLSFGLVLGLLVVFVPLGLLLLFISFALPFGLYLVIGPQPGLLGTVIGGVWLALTALVLFATFRATLRRLSGRARTRSTPSTRPPIAIDHFTRAPEGHDRPVRPTLAELDARLGSGPSPTESP